jgi:hypothetical protein
VILKLQESHTQVYMFIYTHIHLLKSSKVEISPSKFARPKLAVGSKATMSLRKALRGDLGGQTTPLGAWLAPLGSARSRASKMAEEYAKKHQNKQNKPNI